MKKERRHFDKEFKMMAPAAIQQGQHLAKNLNRILKGQQLKPFTYTHKGSMATIGRNLAVAEIKSFRFEGVLAWFIWIFVHLMSLVSFKNKIGVFINWTMSYFSYDKGNRFIIGQNFGPNSNGQ